MSIQPLILDSTGQAIVNELKTLNLIQRASIPSDELFTDYARIAQIVQNGDAEKFFKIGDQIVVKWRDGSTEYDVPMDVVHFGNVETEDGQIKKGMWLQWHYCSPFGIPFDANEAFYYAPDGLEAGTYYITAANSWGSNIVSGESYSFTLSQAVPAGGQLVLTQGTVDTAFASWKVYSYASATSTSPIETVTPTKSTDGTFLGSWSSSTKYSTSGMNNMQRSNYGYNRWSQSALRQYLNSKESAGAWWASQNVFDRVPSENASKAGFLSGFDDDFLRVLKPIKVTTALNTVSDTEIGTSETTYDTFFVPSLEQIYANPQWVGEGEYWEYWKQKVGLQSPMAQYGTYPRARMFALNAKTSAQSVRLRSANRYYAYNTWSVTSSGYIDGGNAMSAYRFAPACVIC